MPHSRWDTVKGVLGILFIVAVVGTLVGIAYTTLWPEPKLDADGCVTEWVAINPLTFADFIVQNEGGVVISTGPNQFASDSDLQDAIWFVRDKILYLSFKTRTHILEADILCLYYDEEETFQMTYEIIAETER